MNYLPFLIKLTESDKRFVIAIVLIICAILSLLIVLALLIEHICKIQSKGLDKLVHDYVVTGILDSKNKFIKVANEKNRRYFYKKSKIAVLLILLHFIIALIYILIINNIQGLQHITYGDLWTSYGAENSTGYGIATIFYIWDFANAETGNFLGMQVPGNIPVLNYPHFDVYAIVSYIAIPIFLIGGIWYLIEVQGFIARKFRIYKLAKSIYSKNLDNVQYDSLNGLTSKNVTVNTADNNQNNNQKNV